MVENIINANTNFEELLKNIKEEKFYKLYPSYKLFIRVFGYLIDLSSNTFEKDKKKDNENGEKYLFLFKKKIKIQLINKDTKQFLKELEVFSSLELENFISSEGFKISQLFLKINEEFRKYKEGKINLGCYISNNALEIYVSFIQDLPKLKFKDVLDKDTNYKPREYSNFFYDYFIYEDKSQREDPFIYIKNDKRDLIYNNILRLREENDIKIYKITGPSSIGKSFTLFYISRILYDVIYINLKTLYNNRNDLYKCYHIIITEFERFSYKKYLQNLESKIKECFQKQLSPLELILSIMELLCNFKTNFVFIFDQYKKKYIIGNFNNQIMTYKNIKIVLCSSINDKEIRNECIQSWNHNVININEFNKNLAQFYFYFDDICSYQQKKYNIKLLKQFNFLPKYIKIYEESHKDNALFLDKVKSKIKTKINEYCNNDENEYFDILVHLRYIIEREYDISSLLDVIKYCLLKFFKIEFNERTFKVKPIFSFMKHFIWTHFSENICSYYFSNNLYRRNIIENEAVKGCYFEQAVKYGLQKICKYNDIITLKEIVEMKEIIDVKSYYNIDDEEDDTNENEIEISYDDNEHYKSNIKIQKLLEDFKINEINSDLLNLEMKNTIAKHSLQYSKNIEDFRMDTIDEIKNKIKDYKDGLLIKKKFTGEESLLLDQIKKTGNFDYAFLYGNKYEKVFIGFQIKCFFNNSILIDSMIDKLSIRKKCQKILFNSMVLFNCKITKWNYILIFYKNHEEKTENININNLEKCNYNNIHYLFYDPKRKIFTNQKDEEIKLLQLEERSDLDCFELSTLYYTNINEIIREKGNINIVGKLKDMTDSFIQDMNLGSTIKEGRLLKILERLSDIVSFKLKFAAKINIIEDGLLLPPNEKHIYIYKSKNQHLILIHKVNNVYEFYDLKDMKNIKIDDFVIKKDGGYYYCLEKNCKIIKKQP